MCDNDNWLYKLHRWQKEGKAIKPPLMLLKGAKLPSPNMLAAFMLSSDKAQKYFAMHVCTGY